ncbi:something about silencing protein 10-like isoform X2 [Xenia sp. Carnegie-2017]|uniref:something about silencing protein 10-like isoform X2 n=1 Tax=Xenia sp. Carnegie-2017 TaxID=2897299 RepID=UPI001F04F645|nr:something about silencing protein 10-like isoform X2 [Xenia sp. Carnegie-2017]
MFELIKDFKEKLFEVTEKLYPLVKMARTEKIANPKGVEYLEMKYQLMLNYLVNICFYLLLKAHQIPVLNHPVIKRLVEYRELLQQLKPLDSKLEEDMKYFLDENTQDEHEDNELLQNKKAKDSERKKLSKKIVHFSYSDVEPETDGKSEKRKRLEDFDPMSYYETMSDMKIKKKEKRKRNHELKMNPNDHGFHDDEAINADTDGKRGISYQISKNKGLTPKRKKEVRNPRLKHRKKFVKAKIKRKSRINPIVKELSRYGGESTGIKSHLTRSVKIK